MPDRDGFLSRWSRRKLAGMEPADAAEIPMEAETAVEEDAAFEISDVPAGAPAAEGAEAPGETDDREDPPRHRAEDIDIDSLTKESDFTVFMEKGVPTAVRRQALRKLWTSDPVLANLDGLNDYEDMDFTYGISTVAKTDWKLGRGFLTDKDLGIEPDEEDGVVDEGGEEAGEEQFADSAEDTDDTEDAVALSDDMAVPANAESESAEAGTMERVAVSEPVSDPPDPLEPANPVDTDKPRSA